LRWSAGALIVQPGASLIGTPRGPGVAPKRLRIGDLGARISALREGRYEAAARLDNDVGLPSELVVRQKGMTDRANLLAGDGLGMRGVSR